MATEMCLENRDKSSLASFATLYLPSLVLVLFVRLFVRASARARERASAIIKPSYIYCDFGAALAAAQNE